MPVESRVTGTTLGIGSGPSPSSLAATLPILIGCLLVTLACSPDSAPEAAKPMDGADRGSVSAADSNYVGDLAAAEKLASTQDNGLTFPEIAPIVWVRCAGCHRPGQSAPFSLISYDDVSNRREQILEVLASGFMPPWLPDTPHVEYENDTRLNDQQRKDLVRWLQSGAPAGDLTQLPPVPEWKDGWFLGPPDLIVTMSTPFTLPPDGPDVYRNFVIPVPTERIRYVRAIEFRPDNPRVVHHAFVLVDPSRRLRGLKEPDGQVGFSGMDTRDASAPDGHFVGWQPGRRPYQSPPGMDWRLVPGTDFVVQVHMQPTGKPEPMRVSVGLYFTDETPTRIPTKIVLRSTDIDIPAGESNYELRDQMTIPVDVQLMAVAPHAHYLGKEMYATAELPDGTSKVLLSIKDWDLNWQSEYRFKQWIDLPAGTVIKQRFVYDNSSDNVRNPSDPPRRVTFGPNATDEMGSLWCQLLVKRTDDQSKLDQAILAKTVRETVASKSKVLAANPDDFSAHLQLGKIAIGLRRYTSAIKHFERAAAVDPKSADVLYFWGQALFRLRRNREGIAKMQECLRIDPNFLRAHHDLGFAALLEKDLTAAEEHFQKALAINPYDASTLKNVGNMLRMQGRNEEALRYFQSSLELNPRDQKLRGQIDELTPR